MNPLWVSLSAYGGVTTPTALAVLWAAGVRHVELAIGVKPSRDTVEVLRQYRGQGMEYRAHHGFVWEGQRSFNLAHRFDAAYFERLTDWLVAMNISAYSVHGGSYSSGDGTAASDRFLNHLEQLAQMCRERSIRLGVETMYPAPGESASQYLLQNGAEIEQLLVTLPQVDLVVDMAHLNLWQGQTVQEKLRLLELVPDRLLEIHVSDNDGHRDSHAPITQTTWWRPYVHTFPGHIPVVLESRMNGQRVEHVQQQVEAIGAIVSRRNRA